MAATPIDYSSQLFSEVNTKIRNIEERQRILKDQVLLLGQNLIEFKEKTSKKNLEIKKDLESIKTQLDRLASFTELISGEFSKFAKKEDVEILAKQAKMFQPLEYLRKE